MLGGQPKVTYAHIGQEEDVETIVSFLAAL
jgi:hypothetical protein